MTDRTGQWVTPFPFPEEAWMLWKECSVMDERLRFVTRLLDGEAFSKAAAAQRRIGPVPRRLMFGTGRLAS